MGDYAKLKSVYVYLCIYEFDKNIWKAHNPLELSLSNDSYFLFVWPCKTD